MERFTHITPIVIAAQLLVTGCSSDSSSHSNARVPDAPYDLVANTGDSAISIGWRAPVSDGGAAIDQYHITIEPSVVNSDIHVSGTRALINNVNNGIDYTISVAATNSAGTGPDSAGITVQANAADTTGYDVITINSDPRSPNGIYDPSLLRAANDDLWLAYSSVNLYLNGSGNTVQDVGIRIARSTE